MKRGRRPVGSELAQRVDGSEEAKKRLQAILATVSGELTPEEACRRLGVKKSRLFRIRQRAFQAAAASLEARPIGRPRAQPQSAEQARVAELEAQTRQLGIELEASRIRDELAQALGRRGDRERKKKTSEPDPERFAPEPIAAEPMPNVSRHEDPRPSAAWAVPEVEPLPAAQAEAIGAAALAADVAEDQPSETASDLSGAPVAMEEQACQRRERCHQLRMRQYATVGCRGGARLPSGPLHQRRRKERSARQQAVIFFRADRRAGVSVAETARRLAVPERTLFEWRQRWQEDRLAAKRRGRPRSCAGRAVHWLVLVVLSILGAVGTLVYLRQAFPKMSVVELRRLRQRHRHGIRRRGDRYRCRLWWHRPGAVWAIDFSKPLRPIDGIWECVLNVRDLASHQQLLWLPVPAESAHQATAALEWLFQTQGPPLVLKLDNGSAFIAKAMRDLLARYDVTILPSPPRRPQYNGSCERSNGLMKTCTHQISACAGRPGQWTSEDLERARDLANRVTRPWGRHGPSPQHVWDHRQPITADERREFQAMVGCCRDEARRELEYPVDELLTVRQRGRLQRRAVRDALVRLAYLSILQASDPDPQPVPRLAADEPNVLPLLACHLDDLTTMMRSDDQEAHPMSPVEKSAPGLILANETPCTLDVASTPLAPTLARVRRLRGSRPCSSS